MRWTQPTGRKGAGSHPPRLIKRRVTNVITDNVAQGHFPDHVPRLDRDMVHFRGRGSVPQPMEEISEGRIDPETCHKARSVAP